MWETTPFSVDSLSTLTLWLHWYLHNQQFFKYITLKPRQRRSLQPLRVDTTPQHLSTFNNPPWPPLSRSSQREKTANKCGTTRMLTTMRQTHTWRSWENPLWSAGKLHTCTLLQQLLHLKVICYFNSWSAETVSQRRRFVALRFRWKWLYYSPIYLKVSVIPVKTFKTRHVLNNTVKLSILLWRRDSDS